MDTDLQMRGRVAQFGRGAMEKISQRMFAQFARNIEQQFSGNGGARCRPDAERRRARRAAKPPARGGRRRRGGGAEGGGADGAARSALRRARSTRTGPRSTSSAPSAPRGSPRRRRSSAAALLAFGYGYLLGQLRESRATVRRMARLL